MSQGQTLGHVLFWRSCKAPRMLYTACMGRSRRHPAVAGIDPEALAAFQAGIRKRYTNDEILAQLRDSAERLGRSPTMREFAADEQTTVHPQTVIEHFGSWNAAKRQAGLVPRRFATREELLGRGVEASELTVFDERDGGTFFGFADPDGNTWAVQELRVRAEQPLIPHGARGRFGASDG